MERLIMSIGEVRLRINNSEFPIFSDERLTNDLGTQIVTVYGQVVDVYDTGAVVVHGRNPNRLREVLSQRRLTSDREAADG
jgi:hypothetical protein